MSNRKFTDDELIKLLNQCHYTEGIVASVIVRGRGEAITLQRLIDIINRQKAEIERLQAVHADMTESLRLAAEANKDMSVELDAMRGAANSYKMHYEETERKYKIAVAEREANVEGFIETLKTIKAEAIKEFAERLKAESILRSGCVPWYDIQETIDTLVKEMTEGK